MRDTVREAVLHCAWVPAALVRYPLRSDADVHRFQSYQTPMAQALR